MNRRDGKRIKDLSGMGQLIMDINAKRVDSEVFINEKMDVTELVKYIDKKKKENEDITLFHAFVTAMGKTIYNRRKFNYFIKNRHLYDHNEVVISFVAKITFDDEAEEMMILIPIDKDDTIDTISKKVSDKVNKIRNSKEDSVDKKGANSALDVVGKLPNFIRVPFIGLCKILDNHDLLPDFFKEDNLYYSSVIVSNLGSIKCGAIYHHLSDFGTCSSLVTIGEVKDEKVLINGKEEIRKICEFGITLDERIGDGYYFAQAVQILKKVLADPKSLEEKMDTKLEYKIR